MTQAKTVQVMDFEEWLRHQGIDPWGYVWDGARACDCGDIEICRRCEGSGWLKSRRVRARESKDLNEEYKFQVAVDQKKWKKWHGEIPA